MAIDTVTPTHNPRQCKCGHNFNRHHGGNHTVGDAAELCRDCDCAGYESLSECMRVQARHYLYSIPAQTPEYEAMCDLINARGVVDREWLRERLTVVLAEFGARVKQEQREVTEHIAGAHVIAVERANALDDECRQQRTEKLNWISKASIAMAEKEGLEKEMVAEREAYSIDPRGCTCPNNGAGDCPWCEAKSAAESQ